MKFTLNRHTMYILVGASGTGKSFFCNRIAAALLALNGEHGPDELKVIGSDENRRYLMRQSPSQFQKLNEEVMEYSQQAFDLLDAQIEAFTSFPVNIPYLIVDSTGMNAQTREKWVKVAKANNYEVELVLFDSALTQHDPEAAKAEFVQKQIAKYKKDVLPNLNSKLYRNITRINAQYRITPPETPEGKPVRELIRDEEFEVTVADKALYDRATLAMNSASKPLVIVGDLHETLPPLCQLIEEYPPESYQYIFLGDYLDKGGNTVNTIEVLHELATKAGAIFIDANHEHYLEGRISGEIQEGSMSPEKEAEYFTALPALVGNAEALAKFKEIRQKHTLPFLKIIGKNQKTIYLTHAPCQNRQLFKSSTLDLRNQRNFRYKDREGSPTEELLFLAEEANSTHPLHIFGHIAVNAEKSKIRNKVFLDTGAVYGGHLSAVIIRYPQTEFPEIVRIPVTKALATGTLLNVTDIKPPTPGFDLNSDRISDEDRWEIKRILEGGAQYVSGTMAPAPADPSKGILESLEMALNYYRNKGVEGVSIQPKYMGSRGQLYLFKDDPSKAFFTSRRGYRIDHVPHLADLAKKCYTQWYNHGEFFKNSTMAILDGEILPWSVLGRGLIKYDYEPYINALDYELHQLEGDSVFASFKFGKGEVPYEIGPRLNHVKAFKRQLEIFGKDWLSDPECVKFTPFAILKTDHPDKLEDYSQSAQFTLLSDIFKTNGHSCTSVRFDDPEWLDKALKFQKFIREFDMEGVVVKPERHQPGLVPYFKVRNPEYLRLVYGYDWVDKEAYFADKKNVASKISLSITEFEIGRQMLTAAPEALPEMIFKINGEIKKEATLDPRL